MAHPRRDGYGRPLPTLAEAREEVLVSHATNEELRRAFLHLLDAEIQAHLRRRFYGSLQLSIEIKDGILQENSLKVQVTRAHRYEREESR